MHSNSDIQRPMPISGSLASSVPFQKLFVHVLRLLQGLLSLVDGQVTVFILRGSASFSLIVNLHASAISSFLKHGHVAISSRRLKSWTSNRIFSACSYRKRYLAIANRCSSLLARRSCVSDCLPLSRGLLANINRHGCPEVRQRS